MMNHGGKILTGIWLYLMIVFIFASTDGTRSDNHPLNRAKRSTDCAEKFRTITSSHSACVTPSDSASDVGVSDADQTLIVNKHNTVRRAVTPTASNMQKMSWDAETATVAQRWAEHCVTGHDGNYQRYDFGRFSVGQNLAIGQSDWTAAIDAWASEKADFTFGGNNALHTVGHYTQMVWADTVKIGCGYAACSFGRYFVCNYGPAGNLDINNPYTSGSSCGVCGSNCDDKLCVFPLYNDTNRDTNIVCVVRRESLYGDCGGKVCLNGGTMALDSCTCSCQNNLDHFLQPYCALNCTGIVDPSKCTSFAGLCESVSNVPQECPSMCNWCPTAGYGYGDEDDDSDASVPSSLLCLVYGVGLLQILMYLQ